MGRRPTAAQQNAIEERRRKILARIAIFTKRAARFATDDHPENEAGEEGLNEDDWEDLTQGDEDEGTDDGTDEGSDGGRSDATTDSDVEYMLRADRASKKAEWLSIPLPSSGPDRQQGRSFNAELLDLELKLRQGQANEALHKLRLSLAAKALLLRKKVRNAKSQRTSTRAWDQVHDADSKARGQVTVYGLAYKAMHALLDQMDDGHATRKKRQSISERYQKIEPEHLKMPGDITEESRIGQKNDKLAWFWRFDIGKDLSDDGWMQECEHYIHMNGAEHALCGRD